MKHSKSSLLLMEMIICIFFFALCAVVCSQIFAQSHLLSKQTVAENQASIILSSLSESFYATNGDIEKIADYYPDYAVTDNSSMKLYFDKNFNYINKNSVASADYYYIAELTIVLNHSAHTSNGTVVFYSTDSTDSIYSIDLTVNRPLTIAD